MTGMLYKKFTILRKKLRENIIKISLKTIAQTPTKTFSKVEPAFVVLYF